MEQVIKTRRGLYGRIQVTLPVDAKSSMMTWVKRSGMKKAVFMRTALMIGAAQLAEKVLAKEPHEGYFQKEYTAGRSG